jgi:hypothetical protein
LTSGTELLVIWREKRRSPSATYESADAYRYWPLLDAMVKSQAACATKEEAAIEATNKNLRTVFMKGFLLVE